MFSYFSNSATLFPFTEFPFLSFPFPSLLAGWEKTKTVDDCTVVSTTVATLCRNTLALIADHKAFA